MLHSAYQKFCNLSDNNDLDSILKLVLVWMRPQWFTSFPHLFSVNLSKAKVEQVYLAEPNIFYSVDWMSSDGHAQCQALKKCITIKEILELKLELEHKNKNTQKETDGRIAIHWWQHSW
jgi:hypothetical protein